MCRVRALVVVLSLAPFAAPADIGDCLQAVRAVKPGEFVKVEYLGVTDEREAAYEIEVRPATGRTWEFECSASNAAILELEQEADGPDDPLFKARAKVDVERAQGIATGLYPGTVREVEYELESDGSPSYEIDIRDADGIEFKVEVDAVTGAIDEVQIELWEIGAEDRVE